ncbi:MAG: right-handed parallel beta-helix repeat-containing protein [Planctomycetia bacterium]|nr:right-handed parallel beta-helix repeat-containing protein [Planctomycetia bacterium]
MLAILMVNADATSGGDGSAWDSAYHDLQDALTQAAALNADAVATNDVDQIWIAEGTYTPSAELETGDARSASFSLVDGVTLYGGFAGTETTLDARDWAAHVTTLSGDLGTAGDNADNAYTVVYCGESIEAAIDGIAIIGGNANANSWNNPSHPERISGGGIFNSGTLTVSNSAFSGNSASYNGGGIYSSNDNVTATLTVTNCKLSSNSADYYGGGVYSDSGTLMVMNTTFSGNSANYGGGGISSHFGTLTVNDSTFSGNSASNDDGGGGAIHSIYGTLTVTNSTLSGNSAGHSGGGICSGYGDLTVVNCTLSGNSAGFGGGIGAWGYDNDTMVNITDSTLMGNSASSDGGGIYGNCTTLTVTNSTLSENSAGFGGGICSRGTLTVTNSTLSGNSASDDGGGVCSYGELTLTNSTLSGNSAILGGGICHNCTSSALTVTNSMLSGNSASKGGGIYSDGGSATTTLNNTIVAGNGAATAPDIYRYDGTLSGSHNLIGDGSGQLTLVNGVDGNQVGTSSSPIDPGLSDLTRLDNGLWGYYLLPGSPAIDAGDNGLALDPTGQPLTEDVYGNPRIQNSTIDIGAVEGATVGNSAHTYLVTSLDKAIANDGVLTFMEAFEAANRNQPVGDAEAGSFSEQDCIQFADGLSGTILLEDGELAIVGDLNIEGPGAEHLTFDAKGQNRVFFIHPRVSVSLNGITVTGGSAHDGGGICSYGALIVTNSTLSGNSASGDGGGIYSYGTVTLTNSTLSGNLAGFGGGIYSYSTVTVTNSTLSGNSASGNLGSGGGIYSFSGTVTLMNSTLSDNSAINNGGGICSSGTLTVTDSTLSSNSASNSGGGICSSGVLTVTNSILSGNSASEDGGAISSYGYNGTATMTITNSTLSDNNSANYGGAISSYGYDGAATPTITDCTLSGNSGGAIYNSSGTLTVTNSTLSGNLGGGIQNSSGTLTVIDCTLSGNSASAGGGIENDRGTVTVTDCTLSGNSAERAGGIDNYWGTLTVTNSVLSGNSASYNGGGIDNFGGTLTVTNCMLSGNVATGDGGSGGGICSYDGTLAIASSTLSGNSADKGGGIFTWGSFPTTTLNNTIVAGNGASIAPDIYNLPDTLSGSHNLIGDGSGQSALVDGVNGNQVGTSSSPIDPRLSDWTQFDNGLWGYYLLPDSPAIDAGDNALARDPMGLPLTKDICGTRRIIGGTVDIGAYEYGARLGIDVRLVCDATSTDASGEVNSLPVNAEWIDEWDAFWIEIWVSTPDGNGVGVTGALLDLSYNTACFTPVEIEYGPGFDILHTGTIDDAAGVIDDLGAGTWANDVGDDHYALLARVRFESTEGDTGVPLDADTAHVAPVANGFGVSDAQGAILGGGSAEVALGDLPATELWPVMYDLDDDGEIGLGDLSFFAAAYRHDVGEPGAPFTWQSDFDHDGTVGLGDLSYLAAAYRRKHTDPGRMPYPTDFPGAWREASEAAALAAPPAARSTSAATPMESSSMAETPAAHDAALVEEHGTGAGPTMVQQQRRAWSYAMTLRQSHREQHQVHKRVTPAIDLMLLDWDT